MRLSNPTREIRIKAKYLAEAIDVIRELADIWDERKAFEDPSDVRQIERKIRKLKGLWDALSDHLEHTPEELEELKVRQLKAARHGRRVKAERQQLNEQGRSLLQSCPECGRPTPELIPYNSSKFPALCRSCWENSI